MDDQIKIVICEPSYIIRSGIWHALRRISGLRFQIHEMNSLEMLQNHMKLHLPQLILVNPTLGCHAHIPAFREDPSMKGVKFMALESALLDRNILNFYDGMLSLFDSQEAIQEKIEKLLELEDQESEADGTDALSQREKEVLTLVVKGMTNKEIAQELFLSAHTVISHRRNIARKLEVHSTAGLTIYAIVNKLVTLDEVKSVIE